MWQIMQYFYVAALSELTSELVLLMREINAVLCSLPLNHVSKLSDAMVCATSTHLLEVISFLLLVN